LEKKETDQSDVLPWSGVLEVRKRRNIQLSNYCYSCNLSGFKSATDIGTKTRNGGYIISTIFSMYFFI
jgi:hypothetical protein